MKNIALIVGKPSIVDVVLPTILPDHADHRIVVVPYWLWGLFKAGLPRGLTHADFPYTGTSTWRLWERTAMATAYELRGNALVAIDSSPFNAVADADETICVVDPSPVEAHATAMLLAHASGRSMLGPDYASVEDLGADTPRDLLPFPEVRYLPVSSLEPEDHERGWAKGLTTHSPEFLNLVARYSCLRFFKGSFRINSRAILDPVVSRNNASYGGGDLGDAELQTLYVLADCDGMSRRSLILRLLDWKGTGRHADVAARTIETADQVADALVNAGLARVHMTRITISPAGRTFLASLHKDCRDVDQFARVDAWAHEWPASRPLVERYLRTFFGKQMRVNDRNRT